MEDINNLTQDEVIESLLHFMSQSLDHNFQKERFYSIGINYGNSAKLGAALRLMQSFELIKYVSPSGYRLLPDGYKIIREGGWISYLNYQLEKRDLELRQIKSTIDTNDLVIKNIKQQNKIVWIGLVIAGLSAFSTIGQMSIQWRESQQNLKAKQLQNIEPQTQYHPTQSSFQEHKSKTGDTTILK